MGLEGEARLNTCECVYRQLGWCWNVLVLLSAARSPSADAFFILDGSWYFKLAESPHPRLTLSLPFAL